MLDNLCRACGQLAACEKAVEIFNNKDILWSIQVLTGLVLENAKSLPDIICFCCQTELNGAIKFSDRVIATQQHLLTELSEDELQEVSVQYKEAVMNLAGNCFQNESQSESDHISPPPTDSGYIKTTTTYEELIVKAEHEEAEIVVEEIERPDDLIEYDFIIDNDPITPAAELQKALTVETETEKPAANEKLTIKNETIPNVEFAARNKVLSNEIALTKNISKKKSGRKRPATVIFVCDECGSHISGRMSYALHCKRHRGEKQHECDVCQYRFTTSTELKTHMRRHTGERPFACHYCDRSFSDYSTRVKHERTHTNERPYACHSCGKAFTTSYILKNHMLTHSGERAFSCDMCKKSFRRQTHLDSHLQSRYHKRKTASTHKK